MLFEKGQKSCVLCAWALSFGCALGWGAFVMPATTLLPIAGPLGTVIALVLGAALMGVIAYNFHIMMNRIPGTGSVFSFTKQLFGYDHSFLCTWATALAYLAVLWANMSAFVLFIRFLYCKGDSVTASWVARFGQGNCLPRLRLYSCSDLSAA